MFKRPGLRFSLFSLLLLLTLAAVSVSHYLTSRKLRSAESRLTEQSAKIRELSHSLGILLEEDLPHVNVRCLSISGEKGSTDDPFDVKWQIHVPPGQRWELKWAIGSIPEKGFPAQPVEGRILMPANAFEWCELELSHVNHRVLGRAIELECNAFESAEKKWTRYVPANESYWLETNIPTSIHCAGSLHHYSGYSEIVQYAANQPVVLYRERLDQVFERPFADPDPCPGMMIWIEPVP